MWFLDWLKPKIKIDQQIYNILNEIKDRWFVFSYKNDIFNLKDMDNSHTLELLMKIFVENIYESRIAQSVFKWFILINLIIYFSIKEESINNNITLSEPLLFNFSIPKIENILKDSNIENMLKIIGESYFETDKEAFLRNITLINNEFLFITEFFIILINRLRYVDVENFNQDSSNILDVVIDKKLTLDYTNFNMLWIMSDNLSSILDNFDY